MVNQVDLTIADANRTLAERSRIAAAKAALFEIAQAFVAKVSARADEEPDNPALQSAAKSASESASALGQDSVAAADAVQLQQAVIEGHDSQRAVAVQDLDELRSRLAALPQAVKDAKNAVAELAQALEEHRRTSNTQIAAAGEATKRLAELTAAYEAAKVARN